MNNIRITNIFNSGNSSIAYIKAQYDGKSCLLMATIAYKVLKFEPIIKKPIVANHTFFTAITFQRINSFAYINSILIQLYHLLAQLSHKIEYKLFMLLF